MLPYNIKTKFVQLEVNDINMLANKFHNTLTHTITVDIDKVPDNALADDQMSLFEVQLQSRRLDLTTTTFLWPEQRYQFFCISDP